MPGVLAKRYCVRVLVKLDINCGGLWWGLGEYTPLTHYCWGLRVKPGLWTFMHIPSVITQNVFQMNKTACYYLFIFRHLTSYSPKIKKNSDLIGQFLHFGVHGQIVSLWSLSKWCLTVHVTRYMYFSLTYFTLCWGVHNTINWVRDLQKELSNIFARVPYHSCCALTSVVW